MPLAMRMNVPASGGMKQNYLSLPDFVIQAEFLKALLLTSATQQCLIENPLLVSQCFLFLSPKKSTSVYWLVLCLTLIFNPKQNHEPHCRK
jgi:hypothetical protein